MMNADSEEGRSRRSRNRKAAVVAGPALGIASSPEPSIIGKLMGCSSTTSLMGPQNDSMDESPSAESTNCYGASRSPYEQQDDDAFFRIKTEQYRKMIKTFQEDDDTCDSSASSSAGGLPEKDEEGAGLCCPKYDQISILGSVPRIQPRRRLQLSIGIKEEEEDELSDSEDEQCDGSDQSREGSRAKSASGSQCTPASIVEADNRHTSSPDQHQQRRRRRHSRDFLVLVIVEPTKRLFELIHIEYDPSISTIGHILSLVKIHASEPALRSQKHIGLIHPRDNSMELTDPQMRVSDASVSTRFKHGDVLIALPENCSTSRCRRLANTVLKAHASALKLEESE